MELKDEGKVLLGNPKSGRSRLRELFTKVVVTRDGHLRDWS